MSMFEKISQADNSRDIELMGSLFADNFKFVRHASGTSLNRDQMLNMMRDMEKHGGAQFNQQRCIYENDDILVIHSVNDYPDKTREAVIAVYTLQDGKITGLETGATPL